MTAAALSSAPCSWSRNGRSRCTWCMRRDPGGTARRVVPAAPCDVLLVRAPS